jgi:uncharacterized protein
LGKVLVLLIIVFILYLLLRGFMRAQVKRRDEAAPARTPVGEDMVTCARCGVNLPRSEARDEAGALVCNDNPRCRGPA